MLTHTHTLSLSHREVDLIVSTSSMTKLAFYSCDSSTLLLFLFSWAANGLAGRELLLLPLHGLPRVVDVVQSGLSSSSIFALFPCAKFWDAEVEEVCSHVCALTYLAEKKP